MRWRNPVLALLPTRVVDLAVLAFVASLVAILVAVAGPEGVVIGLTHLFVEDRGPQRGSREDPVALRGVTAQRPDRGGHHVLGSFIPWRS
ncbi:hypothetical protein [Amycolatopsis thermoflava]|uniref:hypothetical protein n=1 Tax=Amycolatopsis thermoflava TaxID=84480 RepID=UPI003D703BB1